MSQNRFLSEKRPKKGLKSPPPCENAGLGCLLRVPLFVTSINHLLLESFKGSLSHLVGRIIFALSFKRFGGHSVGQLANIDLDFQLSCLRKSS